MSLAEGLLRRNNARAWRSCGTLGWVLVSETHDPLSVDAVAKVARLARLDIEQSEIEVFTAQLGDVINHFADIDALDLSDVEPMSQPYPLQNVLRDDAVARGLDRDEVLAQAPSTEAGQFRVPPIIGLEE